MATAIDDFLSSSLLVRLLLIEVTLHLLVQSLVLRVLNAQLLILDAFTTVDPFVLKDIGRQNLLVMRDCIFTRIVTTNTKVSNWLQSLKVIRNGVLIAQLRLDASVELAEPITHLGSSLFTGGLLIIFEVRAILIYPCVPHYFNSQIK